MEDKEMRKFYPACMFLVTGFCFLLFTLLLSIVDGVNIKLFLLVGLISFILGLVTGARAFIRLAIQKKRKERRLQEFQEQGFP